LLTNILILALFATSLNIQLGYGGMMPLGQATFLGFGAYSFGLLVIKAHWQILPAIAGGLVLSILLNLVIGYLCTKRNAMIFGLLHLSFNIMFITLVTQWKTLTGGDMGITAKLRPEFLSNSTMFFFFVLAVVLVAFVLIRVISESPFGKVAQGMRENEERLSFLGVSTRKFQLVLFTTSGFFTAVAGMLLAMYGNGIYPNYFSLTLSIQVIMMCIIGGMYTFLGPALGAVLITLFSTEVSKLTSYWQGLLGIIIIIWVIRFREGILFRRRPKVSREISKMETNA
jgi:branched-chain amino acid transport system permease protein